jgi:hypothetical protein
VALIARESDESPNAAGVILTEAALQAKGRISGITPHARSLARLNGRRLQPSQQSSFGGYAPAV